MAAKNGLGMRDGFAPNHLAFGKIPILPNLMGKNNPSSLEEGGEEEFLRRTLNVIYKTSGTFINGNK